MAEQKLIVTEIERSAIHDGPGLRTVVFLQGCPLSCYWCCNPETQSVRPVLLHDRNRCVGCGACTACAGGLGLSGAGTSCFPQAAIATVKMMPKDLNPRGRGVCMG